MSAEDIEAYENDLDLDLYREYRDVVSLFSYVVETERRFYVDKFEGTKSLRLHSRIGGRAKGVEPMVRCHNLYRQ